MSSISITNHHHHNAGPKYIIEMRAVVVSTQQYEQKINWQSDGKSANYQPCRASLSSLMRCRVDCPAIVTMKLFKKINRECSVRYADILNFADITELVLIDL